MTATLWTRGGKLVINGSSQLVLCETCPCPGGGGHVSTCNGSDLVPDTIHVNFNFNGNTLSLPMTWITSSSSCAGGEGWEYTGARTTICTDLAVEALGVSLCCAYDAPGVWHLGLALVVNGSLQSYSSAPSGGLDTVVTVSTSPIDYTTNTTVPLATTGSGTHTLYVEVVP